jgi:hypothetical protein
MTGLRGATARIEFILEKKEVLVFGVVSKYAALIRNDMKNLQGQDEFWTNRTFQALQGLDTGVYRTAKEIVLQIIHRVEYASFLEFANDGQNAIIEPMIQKWVPKIVQDLRKIYG